jgi:hypothetical protein
MISYCSFLFIQFSHEHRLCSISISVVQPVGVSIIQEPSLFFRESSCLHVQDRVRLHFPFFHLFRINAKCRILKRMERSENKTKKKRKLPSFFFASMRKRFFAFLPSPFFLSVYCHSVLVTVFLSTLLSASPYLSLSLC